MPSIKCDICGGKIIMQANKTGVCQDCGMEYDIEAIRTMLGQKSAINSQKNAVPLKNNQDEIDRETLLIYLNDIRIMETIIAKGDSTIIKCKNKITEQTDNIEKLQNEIPERPVEPKWWMVWLIRSATR